MTDKPKKSDRIPFESLDDGAVSGWTLPSVEKKARVVFNAKQDKKRKPGAGEVVEEYKGKIKPKPITAEDLKAITDEAKKEGFDQGYQEGLQKGLADGTAKGHKDGQRKAYNETKKMVIGEVDRLNHVSSTLLVPMQQQEEALENIIVDMAMNFAKEILGAEIQQNPQSLLSLVQRALLALPAGSDNISVMLNSSDGELLEKYLPEANRDWNIKVDPTLASGGCRVETLESLVDYGCEHRLNEFLKHIREQGDVDESQVSPVPEFERPDPVVQPDPLAQSEEEVQPEPKIKAEEKPPVVTRNETVIPAVEGVENKSMEMEISDNNVSEHEDVEAKAVVQKEEGFGDSEMNVSDPESKPSEPIETAVTNPESKHSESIETAVASPESKPSESIGTTLDKPKTNISETRELKADGTEGNASESVETVVANSERGASEAGESITEMPDKPISEAADSEVSNSEHSSSEGSNPKTVDSKIPNADVKTKQLNSRDSAEQNASATGESDDPSQNV